jgi:hypothetical protein
MHSLDLRAGGIKLRYKYLCIFELALFQVMALFGVDGASNTNFLSVDRLIDRGTRSRNRIISLPIDLERIQIYGRHLLDGVELPRPVT